MRTMAVFESKKYPELGFYVNGIRKKFRYGRYETDLKSEIRVLESIRHVRRVDKPEVVAEQKTKKSTAKSRKASEK